MSKSELPSEQKGRTNNPGGRPRIADDVKRLARKNSTKAVQSLVRLMDSDDERVALQAANAILDRAVGKPSQHVEMDQNVSITNLHDWLIGLNAVASANLGMASGPDAIRDASSESTAGTVAGGSTPSTRH